MSIVYYNVLAMIEEVPLNWLQNITISIKTLMVETISTFKDFQGWDVEKKVEKKNGRNCEKYMQSVQYALLVYQ